MERKLTASPFVPFDPNVYLYVTSEGGAGTPPGTGGVHPFEYSGWWNEMHSYYDNCYIHAGLNPAANYRIWGKNAVKFLKKYLTNGFENFRIGTGKHALMCNEEGMIVKDGVLLRLGEEEFLSYWLWPHLEYVLQKDKPEGVYGENLTGKLFMYQLCGPNCLKVVEAAAQEDLKDIKFFNFRSTKIAGKEVRILRIGMAGSLAYEVHGRIEDAHTVYNALLEAGAPFDITKIGRHTYRNTHTEGGFPQQSIHFMSASYGEDFQKFAKENIWGSAPPHFSGSTEHTVAAHNRNPIELGWSKAVKFDHDFLGREALEKEAEHPRTQPMTIIWNKEDIIDVWSSVFDEGEPYMLMELCEDVNVSIGSAEIHSDDVYVGDEVIGTSSGRMFSPKRREMISLGAIKPEFAQVGREVEVLWGNPGTRQKRIRARLESWPYISENRNEDVDVTKL